ncbi:MAG: Protein transport protein S9 plasma membrane t-SNARE [Pleopsidium flavum]|nr:MAG: Protein transport protein S9 plasma membrane t-SNARE [Pleopsidium flavum]
MKKFGFGKKGSEGDDPSRSAIFGSRSAKKSSPAPASSNPYAQTSQPPDPYTQAKYNAGIGAPPAGQYGPNPGRGEGYSGGGGGYGSDNKDGGMNGRGPGTDNKYGAGTGTGGGGGGGYGADRYGNQNGYGADRYGAGAGSSNAGGSRYGPGGYGGLGSTSAYDRTATDDDRNALFGGAKDRQKQPAQQHPSNGQPPPYDESDGYGGGQSGVSRGESQGYGAYEDRQLTAEEEEDEDVQATKQEIRFMKQEDVSSTRNALRIAAQAEETGRNTLARLGAQGERIHNTEKNLDLAANHNRIAEGKARELKTLNKSMFAVHVSNPFNASQRRRQRDEDIITKHHNERDQREATRSAAFETNQRLEKTFKELKPGDAGYQAQKGKSSLAERAKYQFEADSEDDEMENEIDSNLDALSGAATRLNGLARATGKEVEEQNKHLDRITGKSDFVDDQIAMNRARLDRFH